MAHQMNCCAHSSDTQFRPSVTGEAVIRELLQAEEDLIIDDDFIIEEDETGETM